MDCVTAAVILRGKSTRPDKFSSRHGAVALFPPRIVAKTFCGYISSPFCGSLVTTEQVTRDVSQRSLLMQVKEKKVRSLSGRSPPPYSCDRLFAVHLFAELGCGTSTLPDLPGKGWLSSLILRLPRFAWGELFGGTCE